MKYFYAALGIAGLLLLSSCDNPSSNIEKNLDRTGVPISVTVYYFETEYELKKAYQKANNLKGISNIPDQYGFAQWPEWKDAEGNNVEKPENFRCDIYVLQPKRQDDNNVLTLGHELMHCLHGSYHK